MNAAIYRESLVQPLNWRYATKRFDRQCQINPDDWSVFENHT